MTAIGSCQTSQTLIISHELLDKSEIPAAYSRLLDFIKEKDDHLFCGMIGLRFIFDVLINGGDVDLALRMISRPDEPSYGSMIARGATAMCESLMENGLNESENHHFLGDIVRIFHSRIAGLRVNPLALDSSSVIFSPVIPSNLDFARGEYLFPSGLSTFGWRRENGKLLLYITLPEGVKGSFVFRDVTCPLRSGYQEFKIENI
jgi:alpha-L-rhamnosidase